MSTIQIGINEPVAFLKAGKSDFGGVNLFLKVIGEEKSAEDIFNSADPNSGSDDVRQFPIYGVSVEIAGNKVPTDKVKKNILEFRNTLTHVLEHIMPTSKIKFDAFVGLDSSDAKDRMDDQAFVGQMINNYVDQFLQYVEDNNDPEKGFRFIFPRNKKGYPTLRQQFTSSQPFMESLDVPLTETKLKFSDYEITNGLDQPLPASGTDDLPFGQ